jgi:hypothetical protein
MGSGLLQSDRKEVGEPEIDVGAVVQRETSAPKDRVITAALADQGERGGEPIEDDDVPMFP